MFVGDSLKHGHDAVDAVFGSARLENAEPSDHVVALMGDWAPTASGPQTS